MDQLKDALARRLSPQVWAAWINQIKCLEDNGKTLRIGLPDTFSLNWVKDHYRDVIEEELQSIGSIDLLFDLHEVKPAAKPEPSEVPSPAEEPLPVPEPVEEARPTSFRSTIPTVSRPQLNPRYIFSNFVVGSSNELAWSAAQAIAESERPRQSTRHCGGKLGKTHLLRTIGHSFQKNPQAKVQLKTRKPLSTVSTGIQEHRMPQFVLLPKLRPTSDRRHRCFWQRTLPEEFFQRNAPRCSKANRRYLRPNAPRNRRCRAKSSLTIRLGSYCRPETSRT